MARSEENKKKNPFAKLFKKGDDQNQGATDASDVLGDVLADKLATAAEVKLGVLTQIASTIDPNTVDEDTITVVSVILDNSISASRWQPLLGEGHDHLIEALKPALNEGVSIMATCSTLEGNVVYPLRPLNDVPLFGKNTGRGVASANGLYYDHMTHHFQHTSNTPLRDRVQEQVMALMAEVVKWDRPEDPRKVNTISIVITDGLDVGSKLSPTNARDLINEVEDSGSFIQAGMFIGKLTPEFRRSLLQSIICSHIPLADRRHISTVTGLIREFGHVLPEGHEDMDTETLLRWSFWDQGLAALEGRLFLPGDDPREIRHAVGQMSQVAYLGSTNAFREDGEQNLVDDTTDDDTVVVPAP